MRTYKGYIIERCGINSSGMRWYTSSMIGGYLKADTLAGIKELINADINKRRIEGVSRHSTRP